MAYYFVGYTKLVFKLLRAAWIESDPGQHVITIFVLLDRVSEASLAPRLLVLDLAAQVRHQRINPLGRAGDLVVAHRRAHDIHQLIVTHLPHLLSMGLPRACFQRGVSPWSV